MNSSITPAIEKLNAAKDSASQQASSYKEYAVAKVNESLNTQFGTMAVQGVDNTTAALDRLLDQYFPAVAGGAEEVVPGEL